jgi:hypothetical protein
MGLPNSLCAALNNELVDDHYVGGAGDSIHLNLGSSQDFMIRSWEFIVNFLNCCME